MADYVDTAADLAAIDETAEAFARKVQKLNELVEQKRDALTAARQTDIDRAGVVETGPDGRRVVDKDRRRQELAFIERAISEDLNQFRDTLLESTKTERTAMLAKMRERGERLDALAAAFPNPTAWLARAGLGSTERANLQTVLAHAGKAALVNYATQAELSSNRVLAAAVVTAVETLSQRERPFKAIEFATRMVGKEHAEWLDAITNAKDKVHSVRELDNLFTRGAETPAGKIERGLRSRAAQRRAAA